MWASGPSEENEANSFEPNILPNDQHAILEYRKASPNISKAVSYHPSS